MKYRKKPVVIEAVKWTGDNYKEICEFVGKELNSSIIDNTALIIETLEGNHIASKEDFIIKGIQGEFYPCKPDIFLETYEEVDEIKNWDDIVDKIDDAVFGG